MKLSSRQDKTQHATHWIQSFISVGVWKSETAHEHLWIENVVCNTRWLCVSNAHSLSLCVCVWINARNTEYTDVGLKIRTLCVMTKWKRNKTVPTSSISCYKNHRHSHWLRLRWIPFERTVMSCSFTLFASDKFWAYILPSFNRRWQVFSLCVSSYFFGERLKLKPTAKRS